MSESRILAPWCSVKSDKIIRYTLNAITSTTKDPDYYWCYVVTQIYYVTIGYTSVIYKSGCSTVREWQCCFNSIKEAKNVTDDKLKELGWIPLADKYAVMM